MRTKIISMLLACMLISVIPIQSSAIAVEEQPASIGDESVNAAGLIYYHALSCTSGSKKVYITANTTCTDIMSKIGFKNIKIQRSSDNVNWTTEKTVSDLLDEDVESKALISYSVSVAGGYYYRVVLDHYAKENTWWFPDTQSITNTSNSVWVPST